MRIVEVRAHTVERHNGQPHRWRDGLPTSDGTGTDVWVQIRTDAGVDGWAFTGHWGAIAARVIEDHIAPAVIGMNPLLKEDLWHQVAELDRLEQLPIYTLGLVDIACWDITAKVAGLPLYALLGGSAAPIPAYASTATFDDIETYLDVADQCLDAGFTAIKLHAWGDGRRDAALVEALRVHVGDDVALMYDGSGAFDYSDALRLGRVLEAAGYLWYEEPMPEFALWPYQRLCDDLDLAVLGAECSHGAHHTAAEWLRTGSCDLIRTGTDLKRGVTGALRIAHLADAFATTAEVHGGGLANLQLCAAIPNNSFYESMVLTNPIQVEPLITADGTIRPPEVPGIGYEAELDGFGLLT